MDKQEIIVGMRVRVEFHDSAAGQIDLPAWAIARRRNHAEGEVVSRIADRGGDAWWVQLDPPAVPQRSMRRHPQPEDGVEIKEIVQRRYHRAPYISCELQKI
jgi:hypothetical protein